MQLDHLAEVKAVDRQGNGQWKETRATEQGPEILVHSIRCSSLLMSALPDGTHLLAACLKCIAYWAGRLVSLVDNAA
jgi:hypothetical protein